MTDKPTPPKDGLDPLHGLWHWTDHPAARIGIALAVMAVCLILFPLLAQITF
jgi:hypothetical protein